MIFLLALAGGIGAVTRFMLDGAIRTRLERQFPWGTMIVNVTGSILLGFLAGLMMKNDLYSNLYLIFGIGFCGGYTTFSTASFETVRLIEMHLFGQAFFNAFGTAGLAILGAAFGVACCYMF